MSNSTGALVLQLEALRLEIRAAFSCLIAAIGAHEGYVIEAEQFKRLEALHREGDLLSEKAQRISRGEWSLGKKESGGQGQE